MRDGPITFDINGPCGRPRRNGGQQVHRVRHYPPAIFVGVHVPHIVYVPENVFEVDLLNKRDFQVLRLRGHVFRKRT